MSINTARVAAKRGLRSARAAKRRLDQISERLDQWPYTSRNLTIHNIAAKQAFRRVERETHSDTATIDAGTIGSVTVDPTIPPLAWLAERIAGEWEITAGSQVELHSLGAFEGVWDGDFSDFRPDLARYVFGSGVVATRSGAVFVPPRHLEEALFALHDGNSGSTLVSNSLAYTFARAGITTDSPFFHEVARSLQGHAFEECRKGVDRVVPLIAASESYRLYMCNYFNFAVDGSGRPYREWLPATREFRSFSDYRHLLETTTLRLFDNGRNIGRATPLTPMTTLSSGYDSAAVSAIAATQGCEHALTLAVNVYGHDDNGTPVANALGLSVQERRHVMGDQILALDVESGDHLFEKAAEFLATFGIGDDVTFLAFQDDLPKTTLTTGVWGDSIWARGTTVPSGLPVRILFGKSLSEFRLRVGFAHVPLPFIGGRYAESARRLSLSQDMEPYSVGGSYDRPIARRLAEEGGVPRSAFGTNKSATSPWIKNNADMFPAAMELVIKRYSGTPHVRFASGQGS